MKKKLARLLPVALVFFCGLSGGCSTRNDPRAVADKFCYLYHIELNQAAALSLASGLAQEKLQKEIELLKGARTGADELQMSKPFIDYKLSRRADQDEAHVMFNYLLTIEPKSGGKMDQEVLISTVLENGRWKVNNYEHYRGSAL
jgi:hypothetical protein